VRRLDAFEAPGFRFGEWEPSWTDADGVTHLGWYRFSPEAEAFLADRSERFGDGTLASAYERGILTAILIRARALAS
jgi:hypothetical protein